jgi:hypothetical protein
MADNRIEYELGLSTKDFLGALKQAAGGLSGLAGAFGVTLSAGAAFAGVLNEIQRGASLDDLSKRTGESVDSLFKLQRGFTLAGISAGSVPTVLYQMQKALAGVNDEGDSTKNIFAAMGMDADVLKGMSGAQSIQAITAALSRMDRASASLAASKIFGRMGAQDMLQLARNSDDFAEGMERAADAASLFTANAGRFDKLSDLMTNLKAHVNDLFLNAAVPSAKIATALIQGFKEARLGEIWELSLMAGTQGAIAYLREELSRSWEGLGTRAVKAVAATSWSVIKTVVPGANLTDAAIELSRAGTPVARGATGQENIYAKRLRELLDELGKSFLNPKMELPGDAPAGLGNFGDAKERTRRKREDTPEANALERIGAIFGGGAVGTDYARQTARATVQSAATLNKVAATLDRMSKENVNGADWAFTA